VSAATPFAASATIPAIDPAFLAFRSFLVDPGLFLPYPIVVCPGIPGSVSEKTSYLVMCGRV
jgi:hypothetical protein